VTQVHLLTISSCGFCLQGQIQTNLSQFSLFGGRPPQKVKFFEKKDLFRGSFHLGLRSPNLIPKKVSGRFFIAA
jgi:hypothetical protein